MRQMKLTFLVLLSFTLFGVHAATVTWDGSSGSNWADGTNWNTNTAPVAGDSVILTGAGSPPTNQNIANLSIASLRIDTTAITPFTVSGQSIRITGSGTGLTVDVGAAAHTIACNLILADTQSWSIGSTLTVSGIVSDALPTLSGLWTFDEASGTTTNDSSAANNAGTLTGGVTRIAGRIGSGALQFDGTSGYVNIPGFSWPANNGAVTVTFWNNVSNATAPPQAFAFGVGSAGGGNRFSTHAPWSDSNVYWDFGDIGATGRISTTYNPTPTKFNKWTHVALVSAGNGGGFKAIYFDGAVALSNASSGGPTVALTGLQIGKSPESGTQLHRGAIDDFRIYNGVLPPGAIAGLASGNEPFSLTKTGAGMLVLSGANTYSGTTNIQQGSIVVRNNGALGGTKNGTVVSAGASLQFDGTSGNLAVGAESVSVIEQPTATPISAIVNVGGTNTFAGSLTVSAPSSDLSSIGIAANAGSLTLSGTVNLSGADMVVSGAGDISFTSPINGATASAYAALVKATGSVNAHWRFNETTGVTAADASGNARNGTYQASPTLGQASASPGLGTAVAFGANQYVSTVGADQLGLTGSFTAMAWVNATDVSGDKTIFGTDAATNNLGLHLIIRNTKAHMGFYGNDTGGNQVLSANTWYHITWRYDAAVGGGTQTIFVNGVQDATGGSHAAFAGTTTLNIGRWNSGNYFAGTIDEPAIFGRALTGPEILALYNAGPGTVVSSLVKNGAGTLALGAANTFSGTTTVNSGTLLCTNTSGSATGSSTVTINTGGTLAGTGIVTGAVTVNNGASVSPGNGGTGTLTVGPTTFNTSSVLASDVGVPSDLLAVQGALTIDGTVNVSLGAGGGAGAYTLVSYSGALTDNTLVLGTTPTGYMPSIVSGGGTIQLILQANSATVVQANPASPTLFGQAVTFTATVSPVAPAVGVATGSVTFVVDGIAQPAVALVGGSASITLTALSVGTHNVQANYAATPTFTASTNAIIHAVNKAQTAVTVSPNVNPSSDGQVVVTAIVAAIAPGGGVPTGSVVFSVNGIAQPAATLVGGSASALLTLDSGTYTITATYSGSTEHLASNASYVQGVRPTFVSPPTLTPNPVIAGQPFTATAGASNATITWNWGDGSTTMGNSATHTYASPGVYTVTVTAAAGTESITQTLQIFVGMVYNGPGGTTGAANPPGVTGILVGGSGAGSSQGGTGKVVCNYVRRDKTTYSGSLGKFTLPSTLTQIDLANQPSTLTIGNGANASVFRFDLNAAGKGKSTGLMQIEFSIKKNRFKFKARREDLTALTEVLGGPREFEFNRNSAPVTLLVPTTLQIGNKIFIAMTFQVSYKQISGSGKGTLAK